jgi:hypothetical protein
VRMTVTLMAGTLGPAAKSIADALLCGLCDLCG